MIAMSVEQYISGDPLAANLIHGLDGNEISSIVKNVLGDDTAKVTGNWTASVVGRSVGPGTIGICIVRGRAETGSGLEDWSAVGKVLDLSAVSYGSAYISQQIEIDAYVSGVLDTLTGESAPDSSFRAAHYYGLTGLGEDRVILWIEDLSSAPGPPWDDDVFITVARHMGQFNGTWLLNPPREHPDSFHDDGYRRRFEGLISGSVLDYKNHLDDPYVRLAATEKREADMEWLVGNYCAVLDYLRDCSWFLAHVDSQPKNLFPLLAADGGRETVAIDWASVGYASLGMDVAQLLASPLTWLEIDVTRASRLEPEIFDSYVAGLRDLGWSGDRDTVRLGYLAVAMGRAAGAFGFPLSWIKMDGWQAEMTRLLGAQPEQMVAAWNETFDWVFPRFRAAVDRAGIASP